MTACVSRSVIQVPSGSRRSLATASMAVDLNGLSSPRSFISSSAAKIRGIDHVGLRPAGIGLGQHLGGHVAGAAAKVLHLDAVFLLEAGVDGIDDLGVEARVEHDLALGLRLVDIDLAGFGWARRPAPRHSGRSTVSRLPAASPLITERRAILMSASLARLGRATCAFFAWPCPGQARARRRRRFGTACCRKSWRP